MALNTLKFNNDSSIILYQTQNSPAAEGKRHCSTSAVSSSMSCGKVRRKKNSLGSPLLKKKEQQLLTGYPWKTGMSWYISKKYTSWLFPTLFINIVECKEC